MALPVTSVLLVKGIDAVSIWIVTIFYISLSLSAVGKQKRTFSYISEIEFNIIVFFHGLDTSLFGHISWNKHFVVRILVTVTEPNYFDIIDSVIKLIIFKFVKDVFNTMDKSKQVNHYEKKRNILESDKRQWNPYKHTKTNFISHYSKKLKQK